MENWSGIGAPPYGYKANGKKFLVINEFEKKIILLIIKLAEEGKSNRDIAIRLNEYNLKSQQGTDWSATSIGYILNPKRLFFYAGLNSNGSPGSWPSLVSDSRIKKLGRTHHKRESIPHVNTFLLSDLNLFYCGHCGGTVKAAIAKRSKSSDYYYGCRNRQQMGALKCNNKKLIRQETIDEFVLTSINRAAINSKNIQKYTLASEKEKNKQLAIQIQKEEKTANKLLRQFISAHDIGISYKYKNTLEEKLKKIENLNNERLNIFDFEHFQKNGKSIKSMKIDKQRELLKRYINKIELFEDKAIIHYKFAIGPSKFTETMERI